MVHGLSHSLSDSLSDVSSLHYFGGGGGHTGISIFGMHGISNLGGLNLGTSKHGTCGHAGAQGVLQSGWAQLFELHSFWLLQFSLI